MKKVAFVENMKTFEKLALVFLGVPYFGFKMFPTNVKFSL